MTNSRLKTFNIPRMMKSESLDEKKIELSQSKRLSMEGDLPTCNEVAGDLVEGRCVTDEESTDRPGPMSDEVMCCGKIGSCHCIDECQTPQIVNGTVIQLYPTVPL